MSRNVSQAGRKLSSSWQVNNERNKVWRLKRNEFKLWGLSWDLIVPPRSGSLPCKDFFITWAQINSFMAYVIQMAGHIHKVSEIAKKALNGYGDKKQERIDSAGRTKFTVLDELRMQRQNLSEILICRHIDNYLTFVSGLLFELYLKKQELLRSSEKIEIEKVLEHSSVHDIVKMIAEKKVESLAYQSFKDIYAYMEDRIGIALFEKEDVQIITRAIEVRNIIVHNKCVINKRFVSRTGESHESVGKKMVLGIGDVEQLGVLIGVAVKNVDKAIVSKFKIKRSRFVIHPYFEHLNMEK